MAELPEASHENARPKGPKRASRPRHPPKRGTIHLHATLPLMEASFRGTTLFAPIPGSAAQNASRDQCLGFLAREKWASLVAEGDLEPAEQRRFVDWARRFEAVRPDGRSGDLRVKRRGGSAGAKKDHCAVGIHFPYELLGIVIGAWCAMMVPHMSEEELLPVRVVPEGAQFLKMALVHPHYGGDLSALLEHIRVDL